MSKYYIEHMKQAARQGGPIILARSDITKTEKSGVKDFVTAADIAVQKTIYEYLRKVFPDQEIVGEEDSHEEHVALRQGSFTGFVVDPIDGTYNFRHDLRESVVCIAHITNGREDSGVIFDPYKDEMYSAIAGGGAFCNDIPIHVSDHHSLEGANIITGNSYDDSMTERTLLRQIAIFKQSGVMPWTSVSGCAGIAMVNVASGRADAFHHSILQPWDNAAGFVLVREAGGQVYDLYGNEASFTSSSVLVGNPHIASKLKEIFALIDPALLS